MDPRNAYAPANWPGASGRTWAGSPAPGRRPALPHVYGPGCRETPLLRSGGHLPSALEKAYRPVFEDGRQQRTSCTCPTWPWPTCSRWPAPRTLRPRPAELQRRQRPSAHRGEMATALAAEFGGGLVPEITGNSAWVTSGTSWLPRPPPSKASGSGPRRVQHWHREFSHAPLREPAGSVTLGSPARAPVPPARRAPPGQAQADIGAGPAGGRNQRRFFMRSVPSRSHG